MPNTNITAVPSEKKKAPEPTLRPPGTPPTEETLRLLASLKKRTQDNRVFSENRWKKIEFSVKQAVELDDDIVESVYAWFVEEYKLDIKEREYKIYNHLSELYSSIPFFAEVSRWIRKIPTKYMSNGAYLPTAAMCYNLETDDFELRYNPRFMASLEDEQARNVYLHEFYHLVLKHITQRRRSPNIVWNIATDLAINSIIVTSRKDHSSRTKDVYSKYLPKRLYLPTVRPDFGNLESMTKEEKEVNEKYCDLIESFPEMKASESYFSAMIEFAEANGLTWGEQGLKLPGGKKVKKRGPKASDSDGKNPLSGPGGSDGDSEGDGEMTDEFELDGNGDVHDLWDGIPEEARELVEGKIKGIVERAVKRADNQSNGWGRIPQELVSDIRASVSSAIDWKTVTKNFVGMQNRGERTNTMKRINKRFPYVHPGTKRGYHPKMLIAIDQSGSVDDASLNMIFSVLRDCARKTTFTVLPFDHTVAEDKMFEWKRGQTPALKRVRGGGTSFQAVIDFMNKPENRGKWDGCIIATDGECSKPIGNRIRTAWLIVPGRKLLFETGDLVIQMDNEKSSQIKRGTIR